MIEGFINDIVLKAKAKTGASAEVLAWSVAGGIFALFALIFLSVGAYVWLAMRYDGAIAGLIVGGVYLVLAAAFVARCMLVRRRNSDRARAQLALAARQPGWKIEPAYVAMGIQLVKAVGLRNLLPLAAAGLVAAGFGASRKNTRRPPR